MGACLSTSNTTTKDDSTFHRTCTTTRILLKAFSAKTATEVIKINDP